MSTVDRRLHEGALELAASAIDFALGRGETAELEAHLVACPACARSAAALRADAIAVRTPGALLPSRRVDDAVYAAIARREVGSQRLVVLAAAALLLVALLGVAAAGAFLRIWPTLPIVVQPTAPAFVVDGTPGPSGSAAPSGAPALPADSLIAYETQADRDLIHAIRLDGTQDRFLAEGEGPAWSPDGTRIVYSFFDFDIGYGDIRVMNADGTDQRVIVTDADSPVWSPDGTQILFSRMAIGSGGERSCLPCDTWVASADGLNGRRVGNGFGSWSPDGAWILLVGSLDGGTDSYDATVVSPDGTGARKLGECQGAAWSPDGSRLACARWGERPGILYTIDVDSGARTTLLAADVAIGAPTWITPDRLAITMVSARSSPRVDPPVNDLYVLDISSGETSQLTDGLSVDRHIRVSPDRAWLVFTVWNIVGGDLSQTEADIYIASTAGETRRLATGAGAEWQPRPAPSSPAASPKPSAEPTPSATPAPVWQQTRIPPMFAGGHATPVAIAASGTAFAAVGGRAYRDRETPSGGTASAWQSVDGLTWEPATATADLAVGDLSIVGFPDVGLGDVAWGPRGFVAVGTEQDASRVVGGAWFSEDGLTWTRSELPAATLARPTAVTWNGATYVMVGVVEAQGTPRGAVWLSADGHSWKRVPDGAAFDIGGYIDTGEYHAWGGPNDVTAAADGTIHVVGTTCAAGTTTGRTLPDCRPLVWRSGDGESWVRVPGDPAPGVSLFSVAASGTRVVAVGRPQWNRGGPPSVVVASDARWRLVQPSGLPRLVRIVAFGQGYLALSTAANEISLWTSPDGEDWAPVADVPQPPDVTSLRDVDVAVAGSRVVIVGWAEVDSALALDSFAIAWSPQ